MAPNTRRLDEGALISAHQLTLLCAGGFSIATAAATTMILVIGGCQMLRIALSLALLGPSIAFWALWLLLLRARGLKPTTRR